MSPPRLGTSRYCRHSDFREGDEVILYVYAMYTVALGPELQRFWLQPSLRYVLGL